MKKSVLCCGPLSPTEAITLKSAILDKNFSNDDQIRIYPDLPVIFVESIGRNYNSINKFILEHKPDLIVFQASQDNYIDIFKHFFFCNIEGGVCVCPMYENDFKINMNYIPSATLVIGSMAIKAKYMNQIIKTLDISVVKNFKPSLMDLITKLMSGLEVVHVDSKQDLTSIKEVSQGLTFLKTSLQVKTKEFSNPEDVSSIFTEKNDNLDPEYALPPIKPDLVCIDVDDSFFFSQLRSIHIDTKAFPTNNFVCSFLRTSKNNIKKVTEFYIIDSVFSVTFHENCHKLLSSFDSYHCSIVDKKFNQTIGSDKIKYHISELFPCGFNPRISYIHNSCITNSLYSVLFGGFVMGFQKRVFFFNRTLTIMKQDQVYLITNDHLLLKLKI